MNLKDLQQKAIEASKPIYVYGGIFIPAIGIFIDINPLSVNATWHEAVQMAKEAGKRLPTIDELRYIYYYKDEINALIKELGGTPLSSKHWSGAEINTNTAWVVDFSLGDTYISHGYNAHVVRAVAESI